MEAAFHVLNYQRFKEEYKGQTDCLVKEQINIYRQHIKIGTQEHLRTCKDRKFHMFLFFQDSLKK